MMILDLNQVMISNLMMTLRQGSAPGEIEENLIRHFILNSIRMYNVKYRGEYGEMVIACDDTRNWRRDQFPLYKANRRKGKEESPLDWNKIFEVLNKIRDELRDVFPYRVVQVPRAEADDVIGTLCMHFGNTNEKILIISGDKDFRQLQSFMNVKQYDPVQKREIVERDPSGYLFEHILRGDGGDGIPNFLSDDDSIVMKKRQKPISSKKLELWRGRKPEDFCDAAMLRGFRRNEQLVDLTKIPESIQKQVLEVYEQQAGKSRDKMFNYFIEHKLKLLMTDIQQF